jgi:hypothetical protein
MNFARSRAFSFLDIPSDAPYFLTSPLICDQRRKYLQKENSNDLDGTCSKSAKDEKLLYEIGKNETNNLVQLET